MDTIRFLGGRFDGNEEEFIGVHFPSEIGKMEENGTVHWYEYHKTFGTATYLRMEKAEQPGEAK